MNRKIKFRAWDKENKSMVDIEMLGEKVIKVKNAEWENVEDFEIIQYTGLKDKNGKEIYEGDIIKAESRLWQVDFKDGCFVGVDFKNVAWDELVNIGYGETEVIGNIYGNPELLNNED